MLRLFRYAAFLLALSLTPTPSARSQQSAQPPQSPPPQTAAPPVYPDSTDGLQLLLADILATADRGGQDKLVARIKDLEIPNDGEWFSDTFGPEQAKTWTDPYETNLGKNEENFARLPVLMAPMDGEFIARSVNGTQPPASDFERYMLNSLKRPIDIYFVAWKDAGAPANSKGVPLGYFMFIDGKFRWESGITLADMHRSSDLPTQNVSPNPAQPPVQAVGFSTSHPATGTDYGPFFPGVLGIGLPTCQYCPRPTYSNEARKLKLNGTVLLTLIIEPDGHAIDVKVVQGLGHGLDEEAINAVQSWRLKPALAPDGAPVAVVDAAEMTFRLL